MNLFQNISIGWLNGWWFSLIFIAVNGLMIAFYPKHFKLRVLKQPKFSNRFGRICSAISFLMFQFTIWYSVFIPIKADSLLFPFGLLLYVVGLAGYVTAMSNYATTPPNQPVTKGIYRLSRNPQQITSILLWLGVGLMLQSNWIMLCALLQLPLSHYGFVAQEKTCIRQYGKPYIEYLRKSRRYF